MRRTFDIIRGDLFDELGNINTRRATLHTGRIVTKQTTVRFYQGSIGCFKRRMNVAEVFGVLFFG